jgi:5-methyltetrahydrofolate--homocysteine methyltransferase
VARLETYLERHEDVSKGRVVLATVYGDVHDIGKNLVKTILSNNGYTVFDLGKQVPVSRILEKAREVDATAIGLSALLVSTSKQMPICVAELHRARLEFPVLIGGAAINRNFGRRAALVDGEVFYEPGVFYCKDAFEGLDTVDALVHADKGPALRERIRHEAFEFKTRAAEQGTQARDAAARQQDFKVTVDRNIPIPVPPFWGRRVVPVGGIDWDGMFAGMDLKTLYRLHWGARGSGPETERLIREEFEPRRLALQREARAQAWLEPRTVYGYFPCQSDGRSLHVYDPAGFAPGSLMPRGKIEELVSFEFPRQSEREGLCLADYFVPRESSRFDVVAFQVVTVGGRVDELGERMNADGRYADALFTHGLAVSAAEGLAEWQHGVIRRELGLEPERGKRYSPGYSACPDLADQGRIFRLLEPGNAIGVTLTSAFQLVPEASTSAIVVHHPAALYYLVKA